jgi:SAM-dependent methyltransferase
VTEPPSLALTEIHQTVAQYYGERLRLFGATARGVDWNSADSQALRFSRLLTVVEQPDQATLLDYGCGYGALLDYLRAGGSAIGYHGFDISEAMVAAASARHAEETGASFSSQASTLAPSTYAVASGIFNVKLAHSPEVWRDYVVHTLEALDRLSERGFSFNMLTSYSDADRRRDDLFYADPREMFDLCTRRFSRRVALLQDYPLYEFTMIVRK